MQMQVQAEAKAIQLLCPNQLPSLAECGRLTQMQASAFQSGPLVPLVTVYTMILRHSRKQLMQLMLLAGDASACHLQDVAEAICFRAPYNLPLEYS